MTSKWFFAQDCHLFLDRTHGNCRKCARYLQVALVSVEDNGFVFVVHSHHLHAQSVNGDLEVRLLSVYHHAHVLRLGMLDGKKKTFNTSEWFPSLWDFSLSTAKMFAEVTALLPQRPKKWLWISPKARIFAGGEDQTWMVWSIRCSMFFICSFSSAVQAVPKASNLPVWRGTLAKDAQGYANTKARTPTSVTMAMTAASIQSCRITDWPQTELQLTKAKFSFTISLPPDWALAGR